jgi:hypothetical protein
MQIRKKGAALQSIRGFSKALGRTAVLAKGFAYKPHGRRLISKYSKLIRSTLTWAEAIGGTDAEDHECMVRSLLLGSSIDRAFLGRTVISFRDIYFGLWPAYSIQSGPRIPGETFAEALSSDGH